tara:strand:+ start:530 stop:1195 length:666 start_codon:yes stop_codon:yes gene_type:complete
VATGNKSTLKNHNDIIFFIEKNFYKLKDDGALEKTEINEKNINLNIYIDSPIFSLIPEEIFQNISSNETNSFLVPNESEYTFFEKYIPEHSTYFIWAEEKKIVEKLESNFPVTNIGHVVENLLLKKSYKNCVELFLHNNFMYISTTKEQKLQLVNRYEVHSEMDILYYTLAVIKESNLINETFKVINYGINKRNFKNKLFEIFKIKNSEFYVNQSLKEINL